MKKRSHRKGPAIKQMPIIERSLLKKRGDEDSLEKKERRGERPSLTAKGGEKRGKGGSVLLAGKKAIPDSSAMKQRDTYRSLRHRGKA